MLDHATIFNALHEIYAAEFPSQPIVLTDTTTAADIKGWDSMAHVRLILAIEERFGFQFSNREVGRMSNVGRMVDLIAKKTAEAAT